MAYTLALEAGASLLERSKACSVGLRVGSNPTTNTNPKVSTPLRSHHTGR